MMILSTTTKRSRAGHLLHESVSSSRQAIVATRREHSSSGDNRVDHATIGGHTGARVPCAHHAGPKRLDSYCQRGAQRVRATQV